MKISMTRLIHARVGTGSNELDLNRLLPNMSAQEVLEQYTFLVIRRMQTQTGALPGREPVLEPWLEHRLADLEACILSGYRHVPCTTVDPSMGR